MTTTALDTETFLIFSGNLAPSLVCVSWAADNGRSGVEHHAGPTTLDLVRFALTTSHTVYANAPFDLAVLARRWPELLPVIFDALDEGRIHDVQTREKLLDLARGTFRFEEDQDGKIRAKGYSLFDVTLRRLGRKLDKDTWRMRYHDLYDVPIADWPAGALEYADSDARCTLEVYQRQEPLIAKLGLHEIEAVHVRAHFALHLAACHGFKTNPEAVDRLETRVRDDIDEVREQLESAGLVRPDGSRNTKIAVRRMVDVLGDECIITTKGLELVKRMEKSSREIIDEAPETGRYVSLSEEACIASGDELLLAYSSYTRLRNLLTGSVKHLRGGVTTPIQSRFEILMETGRTSSSGPNIQNLRRAPGVRECFVPRDGNVLIACDYAAAELHTLAQSCIDLFGRSALGDALYQGIDVHAWVGSLILGIDYDSLTTLLRANDPEAANARQLAKAANFGFPGGCGAKRFVGQAAGYGVIIDERDAAKLKSTWLRAWPEMRQFFEYVGANEHTRGAASGFYYAPPTVPGRTHLRSRCTYTAACNTYFQRLAAYGAKAALHAVNRAQRVRPFREAFEVGTVSAAALYDTRIVNFVHDEIIIECPEDRGHGVALALQEIMEREFNKYVPDCPTQAEPTIMRYWSKRAKPVRDPNGRLIPWEG